MDFNNIALHPGQCAEIVKLIKATQLEDSSLAPAYAANYVPTIVGASTHIQVGVLTGNITIAAPTGSFAVGSRLSFGFTQDGTGGRTITWNAVFAFTANGAGTANQKAATEFVYDGSRWVQYGGALAFKA